MKLTERNLLLIFFSSYLIVGIIIYDNYGVHWDEYNNQRFGNKWYNYVLESFNSKELKKIKIRTSDIIHGPAVELLLISSEKFLKLKDSRNVILMRHLYTFLIFYLGVLFFYLLTKKIFNNWRIGLLGCFFLILHPRIFANSYYNSADIPFLAFYIICAFTLIEFLNKKSYKTSIYHALTCAILVDIRIAGLIMPICTAIFFFIDYILSSNKYTISKSFSVYFIFLIIFIIIFWPYLWNNPIDNFLIAINKSKFNKEISSSWYYNFIWILVTTPILYSLLFAVGFIYKIKYIANLRNYRKSRNTLILFFLFITPIILPIIYGTHLFSGWRHHYFIYPLLIIYILFGIIKLYNLANSINHKNLSITFKTLIIILILTGLTNTSYFIISNHPHENSYISFAGKTNTDLAKHKCAIDYWGVSSRKIYEYLLSINKDNRIYITNEHKNGGPGKRGAVRDNLNILSVIDREKITIVPIDRGDYYISNFRNYNPSKNPKIWGGKCVNKLPSGMKEIYSIKVGGEKVAAAYKLNHSKY